VLTKGIGFGDVKLMAVCGMVLNIKTLFFSLFFASFLALCYYFIAKLFFGYKRRLIVFVPYISIGCLLTYIFQEKLLVLLFSCSIF